MVIGKDDINKLPSDGYAVFPLSMSRLHGDQSPEKCMGHLALLDKRISIPGNDVVFLYTNGLYFNTREPSYSVRKRTNQQMLSHRNALKRLITKKGSPYMPSAFHFLPFDYVAVNSDHFQPLYDTLKRAARSDPGFRRHLLAALGRREHDEANLSFMLEEIAVGHIIREHLVEFPKTLVKHDTFRLIVYPGPVFLPEVYAWQKRILPQQNPKKLGRYYNATYDPERGTLERFDGISLE